MSNVAVIGLGSMGTALTQSLLSRGHQVTVWNRTSAKANPLIQNGAILAADIATAVAARSVVIVCVADYEASYRVLDSKEITHALQDTVVVQLSSGSPDDARQGEVWAREKGIDYLDGAILAVPSQMGTPESTILVAGSNTAFSRSVSILRSMAGNVSYLGQEVGSASALDLGFLSYLFGTLLGFYHAARILESEGLRVDSLGNMLADIAPAIGATIKRDSDLIQAETYANPESSVRTSAGTVELLLRQAREAAISAEFPTFASGLFRKAMAAGYGQEETASLIKVLRDA